MNELAPGYPQSQLSPHTGPDRDTGEGPRGRCPISVLGSLFDRNSRLEESPQAHVYASKWDKLIVLTRAL